jgi:hypothetical protein
MRSKHKPLKMIISKSQPRLFTAGIGSFRICGAKLAESVSAPRFYFNLSDAASQRQHLQNSNIMADAKIQ